MTSLDTLLAFMEVLMILVAIGKSSSVHCLNSHVGTGSRSLELSGAFLIMAVISSGDGGTNAIRGSDTTIDTMDKWLIGLGLDCNSFLMD